jgi:hypothetical protein
MSDHVHRMFERAAKAGQRIPGGCDSCKAYQTVEVEEPGVYALHVHHDDWCPVLRSMKAGAK